jgi:hypothetical protein
MPRVSLFIKVATLCLTVTMAHAQSKSDTDWATNELSLEMMECGQYFVIGSVCVKKYPNPQAEALSDNYHRMSDEVLKLGFAVGHSIGISQEALLARMRLTHQNLMDSIRTDCGNFSVLLERYGTFCKMLNDHPDQRFRQLVQCSANKAESPCEGH